MVSPLFVDSLLHDRYRVLKILRPHQAGWLYLAIDKQTQDLCVLEEFVPIEPSVLPVLRQQIIEQVEALEEVEHWRLAIYETAIEVNNRFYLVQASVEGNRDLLQTDPQFGRDLEALLSPMPTVLEPNRRDFTSLAFMLVFVALAAIAAWRLIAQLPLQPVAAPPIAINAETPTQSTTPQASIEQRCQKLGIRYELFRQLIDELSGSQPPESVLSQLALLSQAARSGMGTYQRVDYDAWLVSSKQVSDRSIETLTDARFVAFFPTQKGKVLNPRTFGQVWYAIARDYTTQVKAETTTARIGGTFKNGQGKVYRSTFKQNQTLKVNLTPTEKVAVWMFSDDAVILKNFTKSSGAIKIGRSSVYEIVIAPLTTEAIEYGFQLKSAED